MAILKDLIVHGSSRFLNKIYADELETSAFEAESAVIKKLTAKDATMENATVIGLLDVQGQLHTNTWTNSNIATIDGCFYITPTLSSDSGKISFSSTTVASLTGSYSAVTSLYIGDSSSGSTVQWTSGSNVLLTGEVEVNGQWLPLGTLLGTLSANASTSSIGLTGLTDNRHNTSSIITDIRNAVSNASLNYRNLKISLYQRKDGNDSKPLGIYMTAMGTNGKTFIDIYGGVNATTTAGSSGGFADPNLRIGNLSGLGAVEGTTPTGWGIYTTNGYFKGVIVSSAGKIGNFTINSALYSNNHSAWNSNVSGIYINNDGISGGAGGKWWLWNDGSAKIGAMTLSAAGVLTVPAANVSGELTAATINGSKITANSITAGQIAASAITADELAANAVTSTKIKAGEVKADNIASDAVTAAKINVENLSAISASMGTLTSGTISYGTVGSNSSFYLSSSDTSATIAGASRTGLRLTVGPNFGVSNTGVLYASNAIISGNITATSGTIGGASITDGTLIIGNANIDNVNASKINAGDIAAARIQTNLISAINAKVSDISALTATLGGFQVDSTAIHTKNVEITSNADNSIALSSADFTRTINNTSRTGLRFAIGDKLGITGDGAIYASSATISGHITATSLTLGSGVTIGYSSISNPPTIPTTVAELTDSGSYLTTSAASSTYATQTNLNNEINARKAVYGTSSTDAGTATKVVTCSNFALYTGASVTVTFSKANTSSAPQLNINSTGAKSIKSYTGANLTEGEYKWVAGASITFTYDGTNWRMQDGGALQAKIDAASSASTASSQAGVATQQATNATNAKTAAESAKTAAESAKTAAQSAKTAAETAQGAAETASSQASSAKDAAVSAKTDAETAKGQAQTAAGNASQSATNAANSATAAAEVMGGFTILWNYSAFGTSNNGRGYLCAFDPATGTKSDANGWVKWNGTKRTITKQLINPSAISPFNIPIYLVCRLSSSTATTGTNYMVWYNSGWKSATLSSPSTINNSWTWADSTDIILGKFVETASGAALTEYEIYNPPYTSKQITTNVVTAQSASASAASAAQTATKYITKIDNTGIKIQSYNDTNNTADVNNYIQLNTDGLEIFKGGNSVAMYGDAARIGKESGNNVLIDNDKVSFYSGTIQLAEFDSDAIKFYDGNGNADSHVVVQLGTDGVLLGKEQESNIRIVNNGLIGCESHGTETFNLQQLDTATTEKVYFVRGYFGTDFITAQYLFIGRDYAGTSQSFTVPPTCNSGSDIILRFHVLCRYRNSSNALTDYDCGYYNITFVQGQATAGYPFYIVATDLADYTGGVCGRLTCRYDGENTIDIRVSASATSDESRQQELKIQAYAVYSQFMIFDTEMYPPTFSFGTRVGDLSNYSATIGHSLIATQDDQVVVGKFNKEDTNDEYAFIVGNGADDNNRSNAMTVDWNGNLITSGGAAFNGNTSITGSLNITGSITKNNNSLFKKEDVTVTVTYAAGTIGSRGGAISLGTTSKSGYTYLGAYILNNQNTSVFSTIISRNEDTGSAILLVYRATGNAVSNATVKVRKIWVLDSFVTT